MLKTAESIPAKLSIALAGNPNTGKTTLFNTLTGAHQKTANYAGVTVDMKKGTFTWNGCIIDVHDLPGTYSLTAYSPDEVVTRDFILDKKPDLVINVLDSTNLERNLILCLQLKELGIPVLGALNMNDEAQKRGIHVDTSVLTKLLGIPFVKISARSGSGVDTLIQTSVNCTVSQNQDNTHQISYGNEIERELLSLTNLIRSDSKFCEKRPARFIAIKLLEKDERACALIQEHSQHSKIIANLDKSIQTIEKHFGADAEIVVSEQRYAFVHGAVTEATTARGDLEMKLTRSVDKILLNRIIGLPLFLFVMWSVFQITFVVGAVPSGWLEIFFTFLSDTATKVIPEGLWQSLVVDGLIGGIGGVLSFVPLIIILFLLISFLEDTGYMARAAFQMDKFLHLFGLHGQSFLPLITGFGCSVPAFMAARTLRSPRDRIATILSIPFISCGAKLPIYVLLAGAFFPENAGSVVMIIYLSGIILALISASLIRRTVLKGEVTPFVMELPPYRLPTTKGILWHVWDKTASYLKKAGTVLLAASLIIWAMVTFPQPNTTNPSINGSDSESAQVNSSPDIEQSFAGMLGKFIEPIIKPMGFDWKIGIAAITGFTAKEAVVSTLGILYRVGDEETEESEPLREALRNDRSFTPLIAFVLMLFMLIIPPCIAALASLRAESGWKWLAFHIAYNTTVAWVICTVVYQIGSRII
jgi:ferrous iron transport protein B